MKDTYTKTSNAFIGASWAALLVGMVGFMTGVWNAPMTMMEKGFYFTVMMNGLFAAISVQKCVRDKLENIPVTGLYYGIAWFSLLMCTVLMVAGVWNAQFNQSEKGFYLMAFALSLFAAVAVQKNTRDQKRTISES